MRLRLSLLAAGLGVCTWSASAIANPRPLPFTYQHEQLAQGDSEIEQYADYTVARARDATTGDPVYYGLTAFQTEFEYGILPNLELGLYFTFVPTTNVGFVDTPRPPQGNGLKQRLRYQFAPTGVWPVDLSAYLEVVETEREIELEARLIVQRRFGRLRAIVNLSGEREFYLNGERDLVAAPSAGLTYELTPAIQPGIEWWMRAEYPEQNPPSPRPFELGPHQYVGPVLLLSFGRLWWTTGAYARVSDLDHGIRAGESYGKFWARTIVGFGL
ncbi:MAG TPA: hypothetical protein VFQ61_33550 [Polyangiaceae bacterium]|nr:hypothetical protein [Polyangiaceae bacterium]